MAPSPVVERNVQEKAQGVVDRADVPGRVHTPACSLARVLTVPHSLVRQLQLLQLVPDLQQQHCVRTANRARAFTALHLGIL